MRPYTSYHIYECGKPEPRWRHRGVNATLERKNAERAGKKSLRFKIKMLINKEL